ncbi:hypothetical protein GCM10007108_10640 [Thermogymnomonas acidicola]|uniref:Uncharacterized protein n=1 Tax=Thermogymnomonas acidicola TaxID=399579 RepID=A0AA37F9H8_9ARCH|nr:hypothetical protein [Thermogymnomonas acidicola]GGM74571.1 hypothetical protein GCM10007108_10640 [Thermogymnomonas acidicola]
MPEEEKKQDEQGEGKTVISIKGVRKDIYQRMMRLARDTGKTVGEITNEAYKNFLGTVDTAKKVSREFIDSARAQQVRYIENLGSLEITGQELREFGRKVVFRNIKELRITDVDEDTFTSVVDGIINVNSLTVTGNVRKMTVISRCSFVEKVNKE